MSIFFLIYTYMENLKVEQTKRKTYAEKCCLPREFSRRNESGTELKTDIDENSLWIIPHDAGICKHMNIL